MEYEKKTVTVNGNAHEILHCRGHGQCVCKSCEAKGEFGLNWTDWMYRVDENSPLMCWNCMKEFLGVTKC